MNPFGVKYIVLLCLHNKYVHLICLAFFGFNSSINIKVHSTSLISAAEVKCNRHTTFFISKYQYSERRTSSV